MTKSKKISFKSLILLTLEVILSKYTPMALAQNTRSVRFPKPLAGCTEIREVSTGDKILRKTIKYGDQNTNFTIPITQPFGSYIVRLIPENSGNYSVSVNLQYSNSNIATVFAKSQYYTRYKLFDQRFHSPVIMQPAQINLNIKGSNNDVYNLSVLACQ